MPKHGERKGKDVVRISGRKVASGTFVTLTSALYVQLSTALSDRLAALASVYESYRFTRFRVKLMPIITSGNYDLLGVAYYPEEKAVPNTVTFGQNSESVGAVAMTVAQTVPVSMNVPSAVLNKGQSQNFYSTGNTDDPDPVPQGVFVFTRNNIAVGVLPAFFYELSYTCEFRGAKSAGAL